MLVLSRKVGEVITIGSSIRITVLSHERGVVRLGIEAPKSVAVHRKEIYDKIIEANKSASKTEPGALKRALASFDIEPRIAQESSALAFIATPKKSTLPPSHEDPAGNDTETKPDEEPSI